MRNEDITLKEMIFEMLDNFNGYYECECGHLFSVSKHICGYIVCPKQPILINTESCYSPMAKGHSLKNITAKEYYELKRGKHA